MLLLALIRTFSCQFVSGEGSLSDIPSIGSSISPQCYTPSGTDCSWYADCLEAKFPCRGTGAGYAIEYGTKFCKLYNRNMDMFSSAGLRWVSAARKCLQVSLAPLLNQSTAPTCSEIRRTAFNSHAPCYVKPDNHGAPSVCDLPLSDYFSVLWTIKSAFLERVTATELLSAGLDVFRNCSRQ